MIHIDRKRMKEPAWFRSPKVVQARKRISDHYAVPVDLRNQVRPFNEKLLAEVRPEIFKQFGGKCAYCERSLEATVAHVEQYRPVQLAGDPKAKDHYWWLAYEWRNLLVVCTSCSAAKRELFPLWGERCAPGAMDEALRMERPVIPDPTVDRPEDVLAFSLNGQAVARDFFRDFALHNLRAKEIESGANALIKALQLNRRDLVLGRRDAIRQTSFLIESILDDSVMKDHVSVKHGRRRGTIVHRTKASAKQSALEVLVASLAANQAFAGARRWICYMRKERLMSALRGTPGVQDSIQELTGFLQPYEQSTASQPESRTKRKRRHTNRRQIQPELANISDVRVKNFRVVQDVRFTIPELRPKDLDIPALRRLVRSAPPREWGWKMLLGENGAGKSTLLQAIAIALMGERFYQRASVKRSLERSSLRHGATEGSITIRTHQGVEPIEVGIGPDGLTWVNGGKGANIFLRAYGSTRLLPRNTRAAKRLTGKQPLKKVDNLFDPYAPLLDAQSWLRGLKDHEFHQAAITLRDLLDIKAGSGRLAFESPTARGLHKGRFGLQRGTHFTPLEHFSAGYQTVLGMACDIMAGAGTSVQDMAQITGIILIDEIGTNLHPTWRLRVLDRLGKAFPRLQLIASTHEPLCLRGMGEGEVAIVQRKRERVHVTDKMPSPAGYRVDQLLTSDFFGMNTTFDEPTELAFNTYYDMLAKGVTNTPLVNELRRSLSDHSVLGNTRRDQVILKAVDDFLARDRNPLNSASKIDPAPAVVAAIERTLLGAGDN